MCTQKPPHDYSEELYTRYKGAFNKYITDKVGAAPFFILVPDLLFMWLKRLVLFAGDAQSTGAP